MNESTFASRNNEKQTRDYQMRTIRRVAKPDAAPDIRTRMTDALNDTRSTPEQKVRTAEALAANLSQGNATVTRAYFLFLSSAAVFTLIVSAQVSEVNVFGVKLANTNAISAVVLLIATFAYYRSTSVAGFTCFVDEALREYYRREFAPFEERDITDLFVAPSVLDVENAFSIFLRRTPRQRQLNEAAVLIIGIPSIVLPPVWMIWAAYSLIANSGTPLWLSVPSVVLSILLVVRGFWSFMAATSY